MKSYVSDILDSDSNLLFKKSIEYEQQSSYFQIVIADSPTDIDKAHQLVHDIYVKEEFMRPSPTGRRTNKYTEQDSNIVFLGYQNEELAMTITAYEDTKLGIPGDSIFHEELNQFRKRKRKFVEAGSMATKLTSTRIFHTFQDTVILYLKRNSYNDIFILVHPRYEKVYKRILGFEFLAGPKFYPSVNNKAAIIMHLDLAKYPDPNER
jgi:hypothetical protein